MMCTENYPKRNIALPVRDPSLMLDGVLEPKIHSAHHRKMVDHCMDPAKQHFRQKLSWLTWAVSCIHIIYPVSFQHRFTPLRYRQNGPWIQERVMNKLEPGWH
jgi:hypothetical protein